MSREEFLRLLGKGGRESLSKERKPKAVIPSEQEKVASPGEPLVADISAFWDGPKLPEPLFGEVRIPPVSAALPKRLGNFPFWRGEIKFLQAMEAIYPRAADCGLDLFLGVDPFASMQEEKMASEPENIFPKQRKGDFSRFER